MSLAAQSQQWCPTSIQVAVLQARGLRIKGKNGTNDAYAVMQVAKEKYATSVVEKSVAPMWEEEAVFDLPPVLPGGSESCTLHVTVFHRALVGPDKLLGQAAINLWELSEEKPRNKTEWFKLLGKTGKMDRDRGEVLMDIQFTRNNKTASMFDLSVTGKPRSRLGKFKDKVQGKKRKGLSVASSTMVPSVLQVLTDSEEEGTGDSFGENAAGKGEKKKKHKLKSLLSPKSNLQRNMSQSMCVLPEKNSTVSGSISSALNVDASGGKKKFRFMIHKSSGSSERNGSQGTLSIPGQLKEGTVEQSKLCINGSHIYCEEPQPRSFRTSSNLSLSSSGHSSMKEICRTQTHKNSGTSVDSFRTQKQHSPWTEEEDSSRAAEEEMFEEEEVRLGEDKKRREELERIRMEGARAEVERRTQEEEERVRKQKEENERLAEKKRRLEEEEWKRIQDEEKNRQEQEMMRMEKERFEEERKSGQEKEDRHRNEEEERKRLAEERRRLGEEERRRIEEEEKNRKEQEKIRMEKERAEEERKRRQEEEDRLREKEEERKRLAEELKRLEEEERRRIEEEERIQKEEQERMRLKSKRAEEEIKRRQEEEKKVRKQNEENERLVEEKRTVDEEERKRIVEEEKNRQEREKEEAREEKKRSEEEKIGREEEEISKMEIERAEEMWKWKQEEEESARKQEEEKKSLTEERRRLGEERKRTEEKEKMRREEDERIRKQKEENDRLAEEKRRLEEQEKLREENNKMKEERRLKDVEDRQKQVEGKKRLRKEEEERETVGEVEESNNPFTEVTSTNPFDDNYWTNLFEETVSSPVGAHSRTAKVSTVQLRCHSTASLVGSKEDLSLKVSIPTNGNNRIRTQRDRRPAPQPPGRNWTERQIQKEQNLSTPVLAQMNKQTRDKDVKTSNVSPLHRSSSATQNTQVMESQSSTQLRNQQEGTLSTSGASRVTKNNKGPAPSRLQSSYVGGNTLKQAGEFGPYCELKEAWCSDTNQKDNNITRDSVVKQVPVVYGSNPFEDDISETELSEVTTSGKANSTDSHCRKSSACVHAGSLNLALAAQQTPDEAGMSQTKSKSSKMAHAPLPPIQKAAPSSISVTQNMDFDLPSKTWHSVTDVDVPDNAVTQGDDSQTPETHNVIAQGTEQVAGRKEDEPPSTSCRLHPVKPLNPLEHKPVSVTQAPKDNKYTAILGDGQEKVKVNEAGLKRPYTQLNQKELVSLVKKQESLLLERDKKISELEQYIDNLLVRIMEEKPSILMSSSVNSFKKGL